MIFANSMSDLFHKRIPRAFIDQVFDTMERADWHIYQVLTKRSSLMQHYIARRYGSRPVPRHIWLGVSVEMRCGPSGLRTCGASPITPMSRALTCACGPRAPAAPPTLEETPHDLCQLHERPLPQAHPTRLHRPGV